MTKGTQRHDGATTAKHQLAVGTQRQDGQQGHDRQWEALIAGQLPQLWATLASDGAPAERAAQACEIAWLRLAQHDWPAIEPAECGTWLLMTARIELSRTAARRHVDGATVIITQPAQNGQASW
jgi:hypothetical protein